MVSNGKLLDQECAKELKSRGINVVQISLDGLNTETHDWIRNHTGAFEAATSALKYLNSSGVDTAISFCPNKKNLSQIEELIRIVDTLGVTSFRIQPMMPIGRAKENMMEFQPSYFEYKKIRDIFQKHLKDETYGHMRFEWGDPTEHLSVEWIEQLPYCTSFGLDAYGNIYLSPYLPIRFGNVKKYSILDYWNNGLTDAWQLRANKELAKNVSVVKDLDLSIKNPQLPLKFIKQPMMFDIIETDKPKDVSLDQLIQSIESRY